MFFKRQKPTVEEATRILLDSIGEVEDTLLEDSAVQAIVKDISGVDGATDYLRDMMANDVKRYFGASTDRDRDVIRGGFARTAYIHAALVRAKK